MNSVTIACVYKTGGSYDRAYVTKLKAGFERHLQADFRFVCLTDDPFADYCVPLTRNWPGWWSKLELFRPGLFSGRVLACDLDTIVMGDLSPLLQHNYPFVMMRDPNFSNRANSCLMSWSGEHSSIFEKFSEEPERNQRKFALVPFLGDQAFIEDELKVSRTDLNFWQDFLPPGFLVNFQNEVSRRLPWGSASLCWWTDSPKPHELLEHPLVDSHWR